MAEHVNEFGSSYFSFSYSALASFRWGCEGERFEREVRQITSAIRTSAETKEMTLAYFALVNNTASLGSVPRASAMYFPSDDHPKSQTTPEVKWVNCFAGPSPKIPLQRLGVPERMSSAARDRPPSGVQRTP